MRWSCSFVAPNLGVVSGQHSHIFWGPQFYSVGIQEYIFLVCSQVRIIWVWQPLIYLTCAQICPATGAYSFSRKPCHLKKKKVNVALSLLSKKFGSLADKILWCSLHSPEPRRVCQSTPSLALSLSRCSSMLWCGPWHLESRHIFRVPHLPRVLGRCRDTSHSQDPSDCHAFPRDWGKVWISVGEPQGPSSSYGPCVPLNFLLLPLSVFNMCSSMVFTWLSARDSFLIKNDHKYHLCLETSGRLPVTPSVKHKLLNMIFEQPIIPPSPSRRPVLPILLCV